MPAYSDISNGSLPAYRHPIDELKSLASSWQIEDFYSEEFSIQLDKKEVVPSFRDKFYYPKLKDLPNGFL